MSGQSFSSFADHSASRSRLNSYSTPELVTFYGLSGCHRVALAVKYSPNSSEIMDYRSIITIEPGKRSGKPCIRGLRITVYDVLGMLAAGMSHSEILADFPYLTEEDIKACLAYAADSDRRLLIVGS